jgi:hypothetical protein
MSELSGRFTEQFAEPGGLMAENSKKNVAQAQFAKLQRATDAKQAMVEYEAEAVAMRARTAQLRALRLARDAEMAVAAAAAPPAVKKPKAARKPKGTLVDVIKVREASVHDN